MWSVVLQNLVCLHWIVTVLNAVYKWDWLLHWQKSLPISAHMPLHSPPLHYSKTSTGYPLSGEYISNWPPWHVRHCTLASHLTCLNCYNNMNRHGLCDLPLLFNSLFHDTTLNLALVHFESQHQKSGIYCLLVSVILHHSLHVVGIEKHIIFSQPTLTPNDHPLWTRPDSL